MQQKAFGMAILAGLVAVWGPRPAAAHHAIAGEFDLTKRGEFTGVLTRFQVVNPHCRWYFDVSTPGGETTTWEITAGSPTSLGRAGLLRAFTPGQTLRVTYVPARNGTNLGRVVDFVFEDGRVITLFHNDPNNPNDL